MTLSSLSYVVFVDPLKGTHDVCLLSSLKVCGIFVIGIVRCPLSLSP